MSGANLHFLKKEHSAHRAQQHPVVISIPAGRLPGQWHSPYMC